MMKRRFLVALVILAALGVSIYVFGAALARMVLVSTARQLCVAAQGSKKPETASKFLIQYLMSAAVSVGGEDATYAKMESVVSDPHENSLWRAQALEFLEMWPGVAKGRHLSPEEAERMRKACNKAIADKSAGWEFREAAIRHICGKVVSRTEDALSKGGYVEEKNDFYGRGVERAKKRGFVNAYQNEVDRTTAILLAILADPREEDRAKIAAVQWIDPCISCDPEQSLRIKVMEQLRVIAERSDTSDALLLWSMRILWFENDLANWNADHLREIKRKLEAIRSEGVAGNAQNFIFHHLNAAIAEAEKKESVK